MKIKSKGYMCVLIYFTLILIVIPLFLILSDILQIVNKKDILLAAIFLTFDFLLYSRLFYLFKINNYSLELQDDFIIYSFFTKRKCRYSNIDGMFWSTTKKKDGTTRDVLKITLKRGLPIVIGIDKLTMDQKGKLIEVLQIKSRRSFNCSIWKYIF